MVIRRDDGNGKQGIVVGLNDRFDNMFPMIDHVPIVRAFDHPREAFQRARHAFVVGMGEGPGLGNTRIRIRYVVLLQGLELDLDDTFRRPVGVRRQQFLTGCSIADNRLSLSNLRHSSP